MKSKVVIIECNSYEQEQVNAAVKKAVELLGGWNQFVKPDEKIILKPNLLTKCEPEKACTTHPAVFRAAGQLLQEAGYSNLKYGDSPGPHRASVAQTAEGCGIKEQADSLGIGLADFEHGSKVSFPEGRVAKEFVICEAVKEADAIINLCKMKTHQLERITGAVKNTFGCVYGFNKGASHAIYPNADSFGQMIADLNRFIKPRLHIMDGILAMEGNGPQSGNPVWMNLILVSEDPVALDSTFCRLIHLDPGTVPTNVFAASYGVGTMTDIEIIAEDGVMTVDEAVAKWGNPDYDVVRKDNLKGLFKLMAIAEPLLARKPYVIKEKCVSCGVCIQACPLEPKAIYFHNGKPKYDHKKCIKCYCCQEMCPEQAIDVKSTVFAKIASHQWKI